MLHKEDIMLGFIFVFIIGVIGFPLIALFQMAGQKEVTPVDETPQKLESPQQPNARLINNALSKHEPELFNYCKDFSREVKHKGPGSVVNVTHNQGYGVTNEGDLSYIHITCDVRVNKQIALFSYHTYVYNSKTSKIKFKQVHDEYNRLVHLIRLD